MPKYSAWLCINRAPWLLTLNEACQLLPYCGILVTPPKKSYSLSALIGESTHHALILNGRMVGSPDPPFFQDLAACEEKGYRCGKGGEPSPVLWSQFLVSLGANLVPGISHGSSFSGAVPFGQPTKIQEDWVWEKKYLVLSKAIQKELKITLGVCTFVSTIFIRRELKSFTN